jgi:hypothetical protein
MESIKKETRVVKYKTEKYDFRDGIDLIKMLNQLKPKLDQLVEIIILKSNRIENNPKIDLF